MSADGGASWAEVERFAGDGNDFGLHRGDYYDISEYASPDTRIRLRASPGLGSGDRVLFDNVQLIAWNDDAFHRLARGAGDRARCRAGWD